MFNLVRRMIALSGMTCTLLLAGVLWVVHRQPLPEIEAGLALCDVPCWAGLEPGRTRVDDVPAIVQARMDDPSASLQPYQRYTAYVVDVPGRNVLGAISAQDGKVSTIRLNVVQPLWPLLMMLDTPRCIEPVESSYGLTVINIYWEIDDVYVMSNLALSRWNPDYLTNALAVWTPTSTPPCERTGQVLPWPGYAALP